MTTSMKNSLSELSKEMELIRSKIKEINSIKHINSKYNILKDIQNHLLKCDEKKNKVELELSLMNEKFKKENKPLIDNKKSELKTLKLDIKKLELNIKDMERQDNLLLKTGDFEKDPIKRVNGKMEEQKRDVNDVGKSLARTEETSTAALSALQHQKKQILNVIDKTDEAEKALTLHDQVLGVMENQVLFHRLKLVGIAGLLFFANILIFYIKFL